MLSKMSPVIAVALGAIAFVGQQTPANPETEFPVLMRQDIIAGKTTVGTKVEAKLVLGTLLNGTVIPKNAILSGEVTLAELTDSLTNPTFNYDLALYLTGDGHGLLILMDEDTVIAGEGFRQTPGPFTAGTFGGAYGLNLHHVMPNGSDEVRQNGTGPITADGASNLVEFVDLNGVGSNLSLSGDFTSSSNGVFTGTLAGLDTSSTPAVHHFAYYLVDASRGVLIETDNAQLTIGFLELQSN
jgi:hypothetical protein